jgi:hypothetical protein
MSTVKKPKLKPNATHVDVNNNASDTPVIESGFIIANCEVAIVVLLTAVFDFQIPKQVIVAISTEIGVTVIPRIIVCNNAESNSSFSNNNQ